MKNLLKLIITLFSFFVLTTSTNAITFEEGLNQSYKTPMVVLVYAQWADNYPAFLQQYQNIQSEFLGKYNFVELDIASQDAKFFNSKYHIYPNLPYVLMYKDGGKISRYIQKSCLQDNACITSRLNSFLQ